MIRTILNRAPWVIAGWSIVAVLFAAQGYVFAAYQGTPQAWWPSLGYALAIFSVWALMTEPLIAAVGRLEGAGLSLTRRLALYALGFPVVSLLHVTLFALVYWPLYNGGGALADRLAMVEAMLIPNAHTNLVFYAGLVAVAALARRRTLAARPAAEAAPADATLRIRAKGRIREIPLSEIDWIGSAGNYAEVHTAAGSFLMDEALTALAGRLPAREFARIHRQAIVRLPQIREVRSRGRGDALVRLASGAELKLSRRYRPQVAAWLDRA